MARTLEQVLNQNTKPIPVEPTKVLIPPVESKPISVSGDSGSDPGTNSQKELEKGAGGTVPRPTPNSKPVAVQPTTLKPVSAKPLTAKPVSAKPVSEPTVKPAAVQKVASTEPEVPSWKRTVRMAGEDSPVEAKIQKVFAQGTANAANELPDLDVKGILAEGYKSRIARDELVAAVPELGNGGLEKIEKFMRDPDLGEAYVKQIAADNIGGTTNPAKIYLDIQSGQRPDLKEKLDLATRTSDVIINNYAKQHNMDPEQLWTAAYQREFPLRQYLDSQLNNAVAAEANPDIILRGWSQRTGYIPELAGSKVTAVNRDARIKQAEDAALRAVTQFDYKLDPVNDKSQNIEGIDPAKGLGIAQPGETGFYMAQKVIEAYEADGGKPEWWNSFQQTNRGSRYFVLERTKELLSRWGVKAGDENHDEMARKAIQRAVFELASAKTVGLWIPPIILPDSLDPNDFSLTDALKPNVEIVGVALRKDGSAHVVRRAESAPSYVVNVIGASESALAGAIKTAETNVDEDYKKELGEQDSRQTLAMGRLPMVPAIVAAQKLFGASDEEALAKPLETADAAKMGILERDNLLQASMNSNWAQPEVSVDFTGETPEIKRSGDWKIVVAGAGGLSASILMPDALGLSGDMIAEAATTYRTIKDAGSVRRAESLLTEIAVNRAAAESLTTEAKAAVEAGDVEAASKLKAKAQEHWAKAKAAEGTAGPDRLLAEAASLEARGEYKAAEKVKAQAASAQGSGLRGEFPLIADHLDRMDAVIASKVGGTHPEIFDSALAESLPFADAEKAKLTLHPSDRRAQLEFGPSTRGQLEYSRLYDSGSHRQALDELAELEKSELRTKRLSENVGNQFEEIRTALSKDVKDQQAVDELTSSYAHLYDDPEDWKKVWLSKRKDLASLSTDETAVRKYLSDRVSRQISELRQTTNDYFEAKYGIDVADKLSPKLSEADATALGISPEDYDRMFDSFENIQTWNHPQYIDSLVADEIAARKLADKTFTENVMAAYRKAKDLKVNAADFEAASNALSVANETRAAAAALARKQLLDQFQMSGDLLSPIKSSKQAVADAANSVWENERLVPTYAKDHQPLLPRIGRFLAQAGAGIVDEARKLTRGELKLGKSGRRFAGQLEAAFGITHDEAVAVSLIAEARARVWAAENAGKTVDDWFKEHIAEVVGYGSERKAKIKLKLKELAKSDEYGKITKKLIEIQSLEKDVLGKSGKAKKIPASKLKRIDALKDELRELGVDIKIGADSKVDIAGTTEDWLTKQSARFADTMDVPINTRDTDWLSQFAPDVSRQGVRELATANNTMAVAQILARESNDPRVRLIAKKLAETLPFGETFRVEDRLPRTTYVKSPAGTYDAASADYNGIRPALTRVRKDQLTGSYIILHELMHAATSAQIRRFEEIVAYEQKFPGESPYRVKLTPRAREACEELQSLFETLQDDFTLRDEYGMTDLHEFVAEGLTNPQFQRYLEDIVFETRNTESLWTSFVKGVKKLLGFDSTEESTALDLVLFHTEALMGEARKNSDELRRFYSESLRGKPPTPELWQEFKKKYVEEIAEPRLRTAQERLERVRADLAELLRVKTLPRHERPRQWYADEHGSKLSSQIEHTKHLVQREERNIAELEKYLDEDAESFARQEWEKRQPAWFYQLDSLPEEKKWPELEERYHETLKRIEDKKAELNALIAKHGNDHRLVTQVDNELYALEHDKDMLERMVEDKSHTDYSQKDYVAPPDNWNPPTNPVHGSTVSSTTAPTMAVQKPVRAIPGRATGVQAIIDRLTLEIKKNRDAAQLTEKDLGKPRFGQLDPVIDTEDLKDMRWFFDALGIKGEKNLEDVALSIKNAIPGFLGQFHPTARTVTLSREAILKGRNTAADVLIHEIWHALTPFIPKNTMEELYTQFRREQDVLRAQNPGLFQLESRMSGPGPEQWRLRDNYQKFYGTNVEEANRVYRYASFDEWIAENLREATQKTRNSETAARTSVFDGAANLLDKIADKILAKTGDTSVSPALNTFLKEEQNTQAAARKLATYQAVAGDINARSGQGLFATIQDKLNAAVDYLIKDKTAAMGAAKNSPAVNSRWLFQDATSTVSDAAVGYRPGGLEKIKKAKTAREAAEILATHAEDPSYRVIAKKLAEVIDPNEIFVINDPLVDALSKRPAGGLREYQTRSSVALVPGRVVTRREPTANLVIHELVHSATSNQILRYEKMKIQNYEPDFLGTGQRYPVSLTQNAYKACQDLESILQNLRYDGQTAALLNGQYGMTDLHEFVAEAMSNPQFQKLLSQIPASQYLGSESANLIQVGKNVWNAFIDKVRIILGLDTIQPSVLDNILEASSRLINDSVENRKFLEEFNKDQVVFNWLAGEGERLSPKTKKVVEEHQRAKTAYEEANALLRSLDPVAAKMEDLDAAFAPTYRELRETRNTKMLDEIKQYRRAVSDDVGVEDARQRLIEAWRNSGDLKTLPNQESLLAWMQEFEATEQEFQRLIDSPPSEEVLAKIDAARDARREAGMEVLDSAKRMEETAKHEIATFKSSAANYRLYQPGAANGAKGAVQFLEDQRAIIHAFENADVSTAIHEVGHIIRRDLPDNDLKVLEDWAWVKDGQWSVDSEEMFARAFEKYLYDGIAPTTYLKKTFEKIKTWMREIYSAVTDSPIDVEIPPHVKDVFDRALGKSSPTSKTLDSLTSSSRIPSAAEELSLQAARSGIHVTPDTIRDSIVSTGKFEFPIPVNGKKTWTVKDFSKLELSLASKAEYQLAVDQPQLSLNLKKSQVVEEKPVDILRAKAAETNSLAAKVGVFVMFGGDAEETMRHMPGAVRRNAVDATRAVSGAWSDGLHLIAEDDLDSLAKFLGGEPTNFKAGRPVPTSGYNYLSNFYTDYRKYFDSLDEKTQQLIIAAIQNQIPERLMGNSKIDKAIKAALYGKNAPDGLDRLITVVGGVPRAAIQDGARLAPNEMKLLRLIAEGSGIVKPGEYLPVSLNMFEDAAVDLGKLKANGMVGSTEAVLIEPTTKALAETITVLPSADQLALAWGSGQGVDAAKATILGLQQIYGKTGSQKGIAMLISHGAKKKGFDILVDSETALSAADEGIFKAFMNGEHLPNNLQTRAEVIAKKFGINPDFVNVPTNEKFIAPRSAVNRIEGLSTHQFEEIKASQETANLGDMLKDASGSLTRYVHGRMTFGGMLVRQTQSFNQIFDHFTGMLKWAGARPAIVSSSRWAAQNLLAISLWGVEIGRPLHLAQLASSFSGKEAAILEGTRKLIQSGSDKAANLIGRLLRVSKYRIEVNDVLEGGDKIIRVGDRVYVAQDLKDLFQRKGVFGTFAGTVVEKSIQRSGAKARTVFNSTWEKALYEAFEKTKKGTSRMFELPVELMEGIAERERVGAAITLIECGMDPIHAAEITVNALYDFAGSMSSVDRNMWTKMILPFWAFQKNANMNFVNLMFSPMGAYRMNIVRKLYDRGAEAVSQILYSQQVDPYGIQPEAIPADSLKDYWMLRYQVEAYFGGTEKVPPEIRMAMRSIFANTSRTIDKGQLYNFSKDIEELFGTGDVNDDGKSNYDGSVRAHFINTYQAAQPPVDKSAESSYVRDRDTIRITTPIADTGMYEATRRYYNLVRPNHPFSEIVIPENDVMSSYKWFSDWLATGIVLATHATSNIDMFGDEDDGTDFLFSSTPLKIIVDPTRAPITSDVLSWFGSDTAYPKRADPKLAALMSSAFGVEYARVAAASDPFVGIPGTAMVAATQEDVQSVYHKEGVPGEYPSVATSPMEAKEERVYLAPGLQSFVFNMSPVGEFSDKFIAYEKTPLEDNTPYWGEILRWARGSLGVKTNEVETGPGRVKQAKAEEVRFDSSTVEPSSKK